MSTNERMRTAVGHTRATMNEHVGVDLKTVRRRISPGRTPHRPHREPIAQLLNVDVFLWPDSTTGARTLATSQAEVVPTPPTTGSTGR